MHYPIVPVILMTTLISSAVIARPQNTDEMKIMETIVMNCMANEGASEADLAEIMDLKLPSTKSGQCFNACIMEAVGVVRKYKNRKYVLWCKLFNNLIYFRLMMVPFRWRQAWLLRVVEKEVMLRR